jgi:hypothetical protein
LGSVIALLVPVTGFSYDSGGRMLANFENNNNYLDADLATFIKIKTAPATLNRYPPRGSNSDRYRESRS